MTKITKPEGQKLLMEIADLIELEPDRHYQAQWQVEVMDPKSMLVKGSDTACGTTACIAGWACILGTDDFELRQVDNIFHYMPITEAIERAVDEYLADPSVERWDKDAMLAVWRDAQERGEGRPYLLLNALMQADYYARTGGELLGLASDEEYDALFGAECQPLKGLSVPEALREIARGAEIEDVWGDPDD